MEKMDGKTMDIVAENVGKLKGLFPEAFTEDGSYGTTKDTKGTKKIDFEVLKELLGEYVSDKDERYSFTWNGKSKARMIAQTPSTGTLRPCKEESVDWDTTQNIFIEGDNLEVLKLLQKSYHKKVKMIYIDPPYNTGKDFVYKDNFKDNIKNYKEITGQVDGEGRNLSSNPETSGRYHTDWLNMMYPRLKLARNLLKDDGVIFIQIDDNEFYNLQNICNEIYGEENFIASLCVQMSYVSGEKMAHIDKKPPKIKEFVLLYAKKKSEILLNPQYKPREISSEYNKFIIKNDSNNPKDWHVVALSSHLKKVGISGKPDIEQFMFENANFIFNRVRSKNVEFLETRNIEHPVKITTKTGLEKLAWHGRECIFLNSKVGKDENGKDVYLEALGDIWDDINITNIYQEGDISFKNGKKPLKLIKRLVDYICAEDDICLDFFAGSATTAHSVFELNREKKQKLKFILVQLPELINEKNKEQKDSFDFCINNNLQPLVSELSKERIRRAAAKIKEELTTKDTKNTKKEEDLFAEGDKETFRDFRAFRGSNLPDLGFKVFKLDSTNIKPWEVDFDLDKKQLEAFVENIKPDRREEDVLYEILLKYGLDLSLPISERTIAGKKVFDIGMGALIICLADSISLEVVEGMAKLKEELNPEIMRVVFKDSGFKDDVVKTNAVQILRTAGIVDVRSL